MKLSERQQRFIDIVQWILIIFLMILCSVVFISNGKINCKQHNVHREETYIKIYNSQKIADLEKQNVILMDSIKKMNEKIRKIKKK